MRKGIVMCTYGDLLTFRTFSYRAPFQSEAYFALFLTRNSHTSPNGIEYGDVVFFITVPKIVAQKFWAMLSLLSN